MRLIEMLQIVPGFVPIDLQAGANDGDWASLGNYREGLACFFKAAGTASDDPTLTLEQASDFAGTGAKALNFTEIFVKQGTLTGVGQFTKVEQASANTYTDAASAEVQALWVVPIRGAMLDEAGGFHTFRGRVADVGSNAQIGCAFYLLGEPRYPQEIQISAID